MTAEPKFDEAVACEACGKFGAYLFDGTWLCADCYATRGSCCAEFDRDAGGDDIRPRPDEAPGDTIPRSGKEM